MTRPDRLLAALSPALLLLASGCAASAADAPVAEAGAPDPLTFADLAAHAEAAGLVLRAEIRRTAEVEPERAPGLAPGMARLFVEARTLGLVAGTAPVGEELRYLVDVPLDARGNAPKLKGRQVLLFADPVPGRPAEIRLIGPDAQIDWTPERESRLRPILAALLAPGAPPRVTGVADALSVAGNLEGESETQFFLATDGDDPASITVVSRPGTGRRWGVSYTEVVDQAAAPPVDGTLAWYRLACFLPADLPGGAVLSGDPAARARASRDYAFVRESLGPCARTLEPPAA